MSISIKFSMSPKKGWLMGTPWNRETAEELAKNLALDMGCRCEAAGGYLLVQFCPSGILWMSWKKKRLAGESQTNIAGPGFHAAVIRFLESFAREGELKLHVDDMTGYYKHRDFEKMRGEYFYKWYSLLINHAAGRSGNGREQLVCWPSGYYTPEIDGDCIVTHLRCFTRREFQNMVHSGLLMAFAKDFFLWNEEEKDAYFYRNCGMVLMNQECCFMPSERSARDSLINKEIIRCLEKALELDAQIPFPKQEYLEMCALDKREPVDAGGVRPLYGEKPIGCRRGLVYRIIGSVRFAIPGSFLMAPGEQGNGETYYDGEGYGGHTYFIRALKTEQNACFEQGLLEREGTEEFLEFEAGGGRGRAAVRKAREKDGKREYRVSAQVIYKKQLTLVEITGPEPPDREWALSLLYKIHTIG